MNEMAGAFRAFCATSDSRGFESSRRGIAMRKMAYILFFLCSLLLCPLSLNAAGEIDFRILNPNAPAQVMGGFGQGQRQAQELERLRLETESIRIQNEIQRREIERRENEARQIRRENEVRQAQAQEAARLGADAERAQKQQRELADAKLKQQELEAQAQEGSDSTEQVYKNLRSADSLHTIEIKGEVDKGNFESLLFPSGKNFDRRRRLNEILAQRAKAGDQTAMFYMGLLTGETARLFAGNKATLPLSIQEYEKAIGYYKKACAAGVYTGCWNVAVMYVDGEGVTKSGLAAAEWFYKAGIGSLANGEREQALAALEAIQKIDKSHSLGKKLNAQLQKGAPK